MKLRRSFKVIAGGRRRAFPLRQHLGLAALLIGAAAVFALVTQDAIVASPERAATGISGTSIYVIDGDTIEDRTAGVRYRIANIDTPETGAGARCIEERRMGDEATRATRALVNGADTVKVHPTGRVDRYGRAIAFVSIDGEDLGDILISRNLARPWRGRREPWC